MICKCLPPWYLDLYRSSLSSSDFIVMIYLAVIRFAPSGSSALRTARKVPLLTMSRISAYLTSIILGQFALGSFGMMISVNRHCGGPASRVSDCLVSSKHPREITRVWDWLLVLVAMPRALCVCWSGTHQGASLWLVVLCCSDSLELSFIILSISPRIPRAFVTFWSQFLVTLSLPSVIDYFSCDCWSTFNCTLSPSYSGSSGLFPFVHVGPRFYFQCWNHQALKVVTGMIWSGMCNIVWLLCLDLRKQSRSVIKV